MSNNLPLPATVSYNSQGLVTAVVQDAASRAVLMVGHMNAEALTRTAETGDVWFWSRSRGELWHKGETSGNYLRAVEIRADGDALLVLVNPVGPTCHTGAWSCFDVARDAAADAAPPDKASAAVLEALF